MTATAVLTRSAPTRTPSSRRAHSSTAVAFPATWGPYRVPKPRRAELHVVPQRTQVRRRRRRIASASAAVITLLTVVAFHALLAQTQVALDRLEQRTAVAERRYEDARFEYAQIASPHRITQRALEMGMVPAGQPPTPVAITGDVPAAPDAPSTTMNGWTDVKPTLGDTP